MKTTLLFALAIALLAPCMARAEASLKPVLFDYVGKPRMVVFMHKDKRPLAAGKQSIEVAIGSLEKCETVVKADLIESCSAKWSADLLAIAKKAGDSTEDRVIVAQIKTTAAALQAAASDKARTEQAVQQLAALKKLASS